MPAVLTIRDETTTGKITGELTLDFPTEKITIQDLIRERVYQEVQDYNLTEKEFFRGLIRPSDAEETLNGFKQKKKRNIDWKKQFEKALEAFQSNRVIILIDDQQAESLEEEFTIHPNMEVTFLKLTLLVGG